MKYWARFIHTIYLGENPNKMKCVQWLRQFLDISLTEALQEFHLMKTGKVIVRGQEKHYSPSWASDIPWPSLKIKTEDDVCFVEE